MNIKQQDPNKPAVYLLSSIISCDVFSYYCIKSILLYYFIEGDMQLKESVAITMAGTFTSLFFLAQFIGGIVGNRLLGMKRTTFLGLIVMGVSSVLITLSNGSNFIFGLGLLIIGGGFTRVPIPSMIGELYKPNDNKRLGSFTLMYTMLNMVTIFSVFLAEKIARKFGWEYGFGLSIFAIVIGLIRFNQKKNLINNIGNPPRKVTMLNWIMIIVCIIITAICFSYVIYNAHIYKYIISVVAISAIIYFSHLWKLIANNKIMLKIIATIFASLLAYTLICQLEYSFMLFSKRNINKLVEFSFLAFTYQFELTNNMLYMFNPIAVSILGVIMTKVWQLLAQKNMFQKDTKKLLLSPFITIIGLFVFYLITFKLNAAAQVPYYYAILAVLILSFADVCGQPIGFSIITKNTPTAFSGIMIGIYKLSFGIQGFLSAYLSKFMAIDISEETAFNSILIYRDGFLKLTIISFFGFILFLLFIIFIEKSNKLVKN